MFSSTTASVGPYDSSLTLRKSQAQHRFGRVYQFAKAGVQLPFAIILAFHRNLVVQARYHSPQLMPTSVLYPSKVASSHPFPTPSSRAVQTYRHPVLATAHDNRDDTPGCAYDIPLATPVASAPQSA